MMRIRIIGIPSGRQPLMERVAFGLFGLAILLCVAGIVFRGINRRLQTHSITVLRSSSLPNPGVHPPAADLARQPASVPEDLHPPAGAADDEIEETLPTPVSKQTD